LTRLLQNSLLCAVLLLAASAWSGRTFAQTADFTINVSQGCVPLGGVNFTDASTGGTVINRDWNLGNGTIINNGAATVGTNYLTAATFPVTLTVTFLGGTVLSVTKNVVVHPKPVANFLASDTAGCAPHTVNFQDLSTTSTGTITNWQWDFGAGGSALPNPSFTYNATGQYNISLIVSNNWGCQSDAATKFQYIKVYTRPTASFTAVPFFGCKDTLTVNFNNTTSGGSPGNTYLWNFGDGFTSTLKNPSHFYSAPGTYTVTLTASVGNNCSSTTTRTVYVGNVVPFFTTAPDTVCINVPTLFSGSATPAPASVKWIFSDNGAVQFGSPTIHSFATPGDYTITFIAFTAQGCSDTITKPIHVKAGAGLTPFFINAPDTVCVNTPATYSGSSTPLPASIRWYFADNGAIQNGSPTTHSFSPPGNYQVSLYVYDNKGCADTISKIVNVRSGPVASFTANKVNGCGVPFTVTFTNTTPGNNMQFTWNFGDGSPVQVTNGPLTIPHTYNSFGNFTVTLTARDTLIDCAGSPVTLLVRNYQPSVDFTYVPPAGCLPLPVFFTAQVSNLIVPVIKYVWNYGDGSLPDTVTIPNGFHLYTSPGVFFATLTIITAECSYTTITKPVTVVDLCDDDGSGGGGGGGAGFLVGKTCTDKYTVTFTDTVTADKKTISWNFGDGSPWYNGPPPLNPVTHTYSPPQKDYIVSIVRLDTITGLTDTARKRVIIIDEKANFVPNVTDICNNGRVFFSTIGIDSSKIRLYTWDFGDGTPRQVINNAQYYNIFGLYLNGNTNHVYTDTGYYYVKLIITDKLGCLDSFLYPVPIRVSAPAAVFGADVQLSCLVPLKVIFTDTSRPNGSNAIVNRQWNFGDGSPLYNTTLDTAIARFYNPNTYTVTLIVTDAIGCTSRVVKPVVVPVVSTGPKAGFMAGPLTSCSSPHLVVFTDTSKKSGTIPITEWKWTFGDGTPVLTNTVDTPINHIYTGNSYVNFYSVRLDIKDSIGCTSTVTIPNYIKLYKPKADFFSFDTLRCGLYNVFLYNFSAAYNATYTWYYGDGTSSTGFYGSHTYATEGLYDIKLVVRDENGCKDSITKPSYIKLVRPKADFKIGDTSKCAPVAIIFTDSSKYASSWLWDFGDGGTGSTDQNPSPHIYALPGFYKVKLIITGLNGCVDSTFKWIRVRGPIAALQVPPAAGCKPLTFTAKVVGTFINTYAWDFGDGTPVNASLSDSVISHIYTKGGKYLPNVVLVSPEGCPYTLKASDSVIVDSARALFAPVSSVFCGTGTVSFTNLSRTTNFSSFTNYAWNFGDGSPVSAAANPAPHVYGPGNYDVWLAVATQYGCVDTFRKALAVVVHNLPSAGIMGDSIRCKPGEYDYTSNISSIDRIQNFTWYVNGAPVSTDSNLRYYFAASNYTIKLVVKTVNGCLDSISRNIVVDFVSAAFTALNPVRCADDLSVQFTNNSISQYSGSTYLWDFGDGTGSNLVYPAAHTYPVYGSYNVSLLVVTAAGCRDSVKISPAVVINSFPKAGITGDSIHCKPGVYDYASAINSIDRIQSFAWYVNGAPVSIDSNLNRYFPAGNYTIKLVVKTINGCADSISRNIIVDLVTPAFTAVNPVRCADDLSVQFINNSITQFAGSTYLWDFGDGTGSNLVYPLAHTYPGYGSYDVSLLVVTANGCRDSVKISPAVVINSFPKAGIMGDSIRCKPGVYDYTSNINSIDRIQSFNWKVNGVTVSIDSNLNRYFNAGNYTIKLVVKTINGCADSISRTIIVDSVKADFTTINPVRCGNNLTVQFSNLSGSKFGITGYVWNFGDGTGSLLQNPPPHIYPGYGNYDVSLLTTSVHGCADSIKIAAAVVIHPLPAARIAGDSIHCKPGVYDYTSNISSIDRIQSFAWYVNGALAGADSNLNYYFTASNYTIKLVVKTVNGCLDSISRNIVVDFVSAAFTAVNPLRCADDLSVQFINNSISQYSGSTYLWNFGDGTGSSQVSPLAHTYPGYGSYDVSLLVVAATGCRDSIKISPAVVISPFPKAGILGDSIHCKPGMYDYASNINSIDRIQSFNWKVNGITVSTDSILNRYFPAGNHTITLVVKTSNGCADSISRNIIVDSVKAAFSAINPIRCGDNLTVQFNNLSGSQFGITGYAWSFGDGTGSTLQNPQHTYPGIGAFTVSLLTVSVHGCRDSSKIDSAIVIHRLPVAGIGGDSIHCNPGVYDYLSIINTFDNIQSYQWKVNGVVVGNSPNLQRRFMAGNYRIDLIVMTVNGCYDSVSRNIVVDSVRARFSVNRPIRCGSNDLTVSFNNLAGGKFTITNYTWLFGDGQSSSLASPVHTYPAPGAYDVELVVMSEHGCTDTGRITPAVVIYKTPTVQINGVAEKCMKNTLVFTSQVVSDDAVTSQQWKINGTPAGSGATLSYFFANAGTYSVVLDIATANGCAVSDTFTVVIRPLPIPAAAPNATVCEGGTVQLQAQDGVSYQWTPAATLQNPNTSAPVATPLSTTWYKVKVTNQFGCEQFDSVRIAVDKKINLVVGPDVAACRGNAVQLTASGNTSQFTWSPTTGLSNPNSATTSARPDSTTTYTVTGASNNGCPSETASITVSIGQIPTVNIGPDMQVAAGTPINLQPVYTNGVNQYVWSPSTGLSCTTCPQPSFVADKDITYRVQVRTPFGCTAADEINIVVLCGKGSVFIPNAFTPNNDGKNDVFYVSGYGIAKVKRFSIYDRWGKLLFNKENVPAGDRRYGWDGNVLGSEVTVTTAFVYIVEVECVGGTTIPLKGSVLLVR
jgi:gliding motility-associated-like protein